MTIMVFVYGIKRHTKKTLLKFVITIWVLLLLQLFIHVTNRQLLQSFFYMGTDGTSTYKRKRFPAHLKLDHDRRTDCKENKFKTDSTKSASLSILSSELRKKLILAVEPEASVVNMTTACKELRIEYKDPIDLCRIGQAECLQKALPNALEDRIRQLAFRPNLQVPQEYMVVLNKMAAGISGFYDIIIVTAFSSNHFQQSQAMLKNVHEKVFPVLKNFTLVIYDIGLNESERDEVRHFCRCTLIVFPFDSFPEHFRTLKCFAWKVAAVRAMHEKANVVIWSDSSMRITSPSVFLEFIERTRQRGIQQRYLRTHNKNPYHTLVQMFHHFGDSPCAHMAFDQAETGYGMYHREPLVQHAILNPWFGCALRAECICPIKDQQKVQRCPPATGRKIGLCMRNEQSAISIILAKLFREKYRFFMVTMSSFQRVRREEIYPYFKELLERQKEPNTLPHIQPVIKPVNSSKVYSESSINETMN